MKTILKYVLLGQLIIISSIAQATVTHIISHQEALQLIQKNMLEVVRTIALGSPKKSLHEEIFQRHVVRFPWLPGYIIKKDPESRIKVANEILKPCIQEHQLTLLRLPGLWSLPFIT